MTASALILAVVTALFASEVLSAIAAEPLKFTPLAVTSPLILIALVVSNVVAVEALPVSAPVNPVVVITPVLGLYVKVEYRLHHQRVLKRLFHLQYYSRLQ